MFNVKMRLQSHLMEMGIDYSEFFVGNVIPILFKNNLIDVKIMSIDYLSEIDDFHIYASIWDDKTYPNNDILELSVKTLENAITNVREHFSYRYKPSLSEELRKTWIPIGILNYILYDESHSDSDENDVKKEAKKVKVRKYTKLPGEEKEAFEMLTNACMKALNVPTSFITGKESDEDDVDEDVSEEYESIFTKPEDIEKKEAEMKEKEETESLSKEEFFRISEEHSDEINQVRLKNLADKICKFIIMNQDNEIDDDTIRSMYKYHYHLNDTPTPHIPSLLETTIETASGFNVMNDIFIKSMYVPYTLKFFVNKITRLDYSIKSIRCDIDKNENEDCINPYNLFDITIKKGDKSVTIDSCVLKTINLSRERDNENYIIFIYKDPSEGKEIEIKLDNNDIYQLCKGENFVIDSKFCTRSVYIMKNLDHSIDNLVKELKDAGILIESCD